MIRGFPGRDRRVAPEVPAGSGFGLTLGLRMAWSRIGAGARRAELSYARVAARPTKGVGVRMVFPRGVDARPRGPQSPLHELGTECVWNRTPTG
jgi:hypothetical protein